MLTLTLAAAAFLAAARPQPLPQAPSPAPGRDTLHLAAVGDLNLGCMLAWRFLLKGDTLYPFQALRDTLQAADILFGNLESPIAPAGHRYEQTGSAVFSAPPVAADALARAGFDVVSNANNPHVLQPVEWYHGKPLAYSMGNFIFRQGSPWTDLSAVFQFTVVPDGTISLDLVPARSGFQARLASGAGVDSIHQRMGIRRRSPILSAP